MRAELATLRHLGPMRTPRRQGEWERGANGDETLELTIRVPLADLQASTANSLPTNAMAVGRLLSRWRSLRDAEFKTGVSGESGWNMLLDLYLSEGARHPVCVSSLCAASGVPTSTALRHIRALERATLIERVADPADRRRWFVRLTSETAERMKGLLERCVPLQDSDHRRR